MAITRAQRVLGVNPNLSSWLEHNLTGSNRWILLSGEGMCESCFQDVACFVFNDSLHRDRQEVLCLDCARQDNVKRQDPIVKWSLSLFI